MSAAEHTPHELADLRPAGRHARPTRGSAAWTPTTRCAPRPRPTTKASGRARRASCWRGRRRSRKTLDAEQRAVLQVVRGRHAQRVVQLPRPQRRRRPRRQGRDHLRGRRRQRHAASRYARTARAHLPHRQRAEGARRQEGRPRHHLHVDVGRGRGRDAGLRAHRRDALGGVRRLLGAEPARPHRSTPAPWSSSPPTSSCAAASTLPLKAIVDEALALGGCDSGQGRHRLQAHRRRHRLDAARPAGCTS